GPTGPVAKSLTIEGLADPSDPAAPPPPSIDGGSTSAVIVDATTVSTVTLHDMIIRSSVAGGATITTGGKAQTALLRVDLQSTDTGTASEAVDCNPNSNGNKAGSLLIDQSVIHDSAGGVRVRGKCTALLTNTLFQNNGSATSSQGAISIEGS